MMSRRDKKQLIVIAVIFFAVIGGMLSFAFSSTSYARALSISAIVGTFGIGLTVNTITIVLDGKIGTGPRGGPVADFVRRDEQPARFWRIVAVLIFGSIFLLFAALALLMKWVELPSA